MLVNVNSNYSFMSISSTQKIVAALLGIAMVLTLAVGLTVPAQAQTMTATYARNLTVGSRGDDVVALQTMLEAKGFLVMPVGVAKGYFGSLTKAALAKFQAANGIAPAVGYFGPITRAFVGSNGGTSGPVNCPAGYVCSPTGGSSGPLTGGAGSVDSYTLISGLNNEKVGEGADDVKVAGLEIEADEGSDLRLTAVRLVFDEGTANQDFEDYASDVSIWLDGKEVANLDADEFNDDNDWTKTVSITGSAVIKAGESSDLEVAVSGQDNLDTNDINDTWTVDFRTIRFVDAQNASTSEDPGKDPRTFSFASFASANDAELQISEDSSAVNDAHTIAVDATDDTDGVELLSFELEAEGDSDLTVKKLTASTTVTGATHVDQIVRRIYLVIDGEEIDGEAFHDSDGVNVGTDEAYLFDDVDVTIDAGDSVKASIKADLFSVADDLDEGDTIQVQITENETDVTTGWDVEDESGEQLGDSGITGSATADAHALYADGIKVALVSTDTEEKAIDGDDNDYVNLTLVFDVTAFGEDVFIPNVKTDVSSSTSSTGGVPTTAQGVGYHLQFTSNGIASSSVVEVLTSTADEGTNAFEINQGDTERFTLKITVTNSAATGAIDADQFRAILTGINFASTDSATGESVFTSGLQDTFRTGYARVAN